MKKQVKRVTVNFAILLKKCTVKLSVMQKMIYISNTKYIFELSGGYTIYPLVVYNYDVTNLMCDSKQNFIAQSRIANF